MTFDAPSTNSCTWPYAPTLVRRVNASSGGGEGASGAGAGAVESDGSARRLRWARPAARGTGRSQEPPAGGQPAREQPALEQPATGAASVGLAGAAVALGAAAPAGGEVGATGAAIGGSSRSSTGAASARPGRSSRATATARTVRVDLRRTRLGYLDARRPVAKLIDASYERPRRPADSAGQAPPEIPAFCKGRTARAGGGAR